MALTFTLEDVEKLRDIVAEGVAKGLSDIGLGYDDEEGLQAIRADHAWTRSHRVADHDRRKSIRKGLVSALTMTIAGGVLYLAVHLHDFSVFLSHLAGGA